MAAAISLKPPMWPASMGLVDPTYRHLYRDLGPVFPMWERSGSRIHDVSGFKSFATISGAAWDVGEWGPQLSFPGASDYAQALGSVATRFQGATQQTHIVVCSHTTNELGAALSVTTGTDAGQDSVILYPYDTVGGSGFRVHYNTTNPIDENGVDRADGKPHVFIYTQRAVNDHEAYVDGVSVDTDSSSKTMDSAVDEYNIGSWHTDAQDFNGKIQFTASLRRGINDQEARLITRDIFGLVRPHFESGGRLHSTAAASVPVVRGLETGNDYGATAARLNGALVA